MPRPASRRGAAPAAPGTDVVQVLPPRRATHWRDGLLLTAAGITGMGVAPLVGYPELGPVAGCAGPGAGAAVIAWGTVQRRRGALRDRLVEALAPLMGTRGPNRRTVTLSHWDSYWSARTPRRITLRYAPGAKDVDPDWKGVVTDVVNQRLDASYTIAQHDPRHCVVRLEFNDAIETEVYAARKRVDRSIKELIGSTAKVTCVGYEDSQPVRIEVTHEAGTKLAAAGYRARVERTVSSLFQGRWRARWDLEADTAVFELRPSFPKFIPAPPVEVDPDKDVLTTYDEVEIPIGVDEDGTVLVWRPAIDPNLMVVGAPGTGKTVFEHGVLAAVSCFHWPIWVVDGKSIEFLGFRDWPNVQVVATNVAEQVAVIERAWELMEHRYQLIVKGMASESAFEPLMLFLDEFADFRANLMDWYSTVKRKGDPPKPAVLAKLASIARKGRSSRVHLLFATQRPDAEYFGGDMRDNFRMRVSTGRLSPQGAMMMWQDPSIGIAIPRGCRGRATAINDENKAVEIQTYYVPDPRKAYGFDRAHDIEHLERLRPSQQRHDRLLIMVPEAEDDLDTGEEILPSYREFAEAAWVRASDRPELDPVQSARTIDREHARELASPMTIFGITGTRVPMGKVPEPAGVSEDAEPGEQFDPFEGYGPAVERTAGDISIGDMVEVADGRWAVVDSEPDTDLSDPDAMAITWRDDADEDGILLLGEGEVVGVRRPAEVD